MEIALPEFTLASMIERCQKERAKFQQDGVSTSSACLEIFRRAFTNAEDQQDAWAAIYALFERMMRKWASVQSQVDPEDVMQEAFLAFTRAAPKKLDLLNHQSLGPLVQYMKLCIKSASLQRMRKREVLTPPASLEAYFDSLESSDEIAQATLRLDFEKRLDELLESAEDRLVLSCVLKAM
jgi:DNA-directed RNA polymerase specialized sigma24 family protein